MEQAKVYKLGEATVAREVAQAEFERFCESMDLDVDTSRMDEDDLKGFDEAREVMLRAIERGRMVIDEKGQPVYTPQSGSLKSITFREPTGANFMAMDGKKKGHDVARMFAVLAEMTGVDAKEFGKLAARDFKVCRTIVTLFLG
jgi:hypothetical protein